jgi:uncharacterized membrane protein YhaH (DUF805 family)
MNIMYLLTSYQGRIRRLHFWLGLIGAGVVFGVIYGIITSMSMSAIANGGSPNPILMILGFIVDLVWLYVALAIYVKRAHDRDKTGWFVAIILIPIIGAIWLLIDLGFLDGTQGPNRFGPSPKGIGETPSPAAAE